jgi:flagellar export protein FliJ
MRRASNIRRSRLHAEPPASITSLVSGPSFRFGLERVRSVRKHGEQVAQQQLAGAIGLRDDCEAELKVAEQRAGGAHSGQRAASDRLLSASELLSHQAWIERTELAQASVADSLSRHEREVDRRRKALTAAARETKALDRLEARRRSDFERAAARREAFASDEIALNVFRGDAA